MIVIIDYGIGNTASIRNMVRHAGGDAIVSSDPEVIAAASALILPGVGAFDRAMGRLTDGPLFDVIREYGLSGRPLLGICLGMQLLFEQSEEGVLAGLGLVPGDVRRFDFKGNSTAHKLKIPHMGWNIVRPGRGGDCLFKGDEPEWRFYFVHSYHVVCADQSDVLATCNYGGDFTCVIRRGNIFGAQFHPEKSHRFGKQLFANFLECIC